MKYFSPLIGIVLSVGLCFGQENVEREGILNLRSGAFTLKFTLPKSFVENNIESETKYRFGDYQRLSYDSESLDVGKVSLYVWPREVQRKFRKAELGKFPNIVLDNYATRIPPAKEFKIKRGDNLVFYRSGGTFRKDAEQTFGCKQFGNVVVCVIVTWGNGMQTKFDDTAAEIVTTTLESLSCSRYTSTGSTVPVKK